MRQSGEHVLSLGRLVAQARGGAVERLGASGFVA